MTWTILQVRHICFSLFPFVLSFASVASARGDLPHWLSPILCPHSLAHRISLLVMPSSLITSKRHCSSLPSGWGAGTARSRASLVGPMAHCPAPHSGGSPCSGSCSHLAVWSVTWPYDTAADHRREFL